MIRIARTSSRRRATAGFTIIELLAVMTIMAVTAAVAVPAFRSLPRTRERIAAATLQRDLTFTRQRALSTGIRTWASFDLAAQTWGLLTESISQPGLAQATPLADALQAGSFITQLNIGEYAGVTIASASFDGGSAIGFDWLGRPLAPSDAPLGAPGVIRFARGAVVTVEPASGAVSWTP
jgi:prepilin-type N-terminal cleavage/methylation domain-containing protein